MNYRIQDYMKLIIPGLYVVAFVVGWQLLSPENNLDTSKIKDAANIIVLLIPFFGFVVGYFIECVMAIIEHLFYILGGRRPSKTVLSCDMHGLYALEAKNKIHSKHNIGESLSNAEANMILQVAKQSIDREKVEVFRLNSMLARNIFGSQLLLTILYAFISNCFYKDGYFYASSTVALLFLLYWFHHTHVYIKYILAEYGKTLTE